MKKRMFSRAAALGTAVMMAVGMVPGAAFAQTDPMQYSTAAFESAYTYTGDDLGAVWSKQATTFRVWAPTAGSVKVNLFKSGTPGTDDLMKQLDTGEGRSGDG